jgi:DEAD/DEAH box helicase domain-containing protein
VPLNRFSHELWAQEGADARFATERLLRLGARARWQADELPLFPHKLHFLIRSPVAPMACVNPDCGHPSGYRLPGAGPVLSASREVCPCCTSQTLPLARCGSCGEWFLGATHNSVDNRFRPLRDWREGEPNEDEEDDGDEGSGLFLRPAASGATAWEPYQLSDGRREMSGAHVRLTKHDRCTRCGDKKFELVQLGDTPGLGLAAETMLASMPPLAGPDRAWKPADGRRLIAFNDSRQSAARLGPTLTSTHEVQMSRAMIAGCLRETGLSV